MCLWCQVERRVYRSYEEQERRALEEIRRIQAECSGADAGGEDCPDRLRCLWEKKLEFVVARIQKERLALEMAGQEACESRGSLRKRSRAARNAPAPTLPRHLLGSFERTIETLFDRLTRGSLPAEAGTSGRKLIPFEGPGPSSH